MTSALCLDKNVEAELRAIAGNNVCATFLLFLLLDIYFIIIIMNPFFF